MSFCNDVSKMLGSSLKLIEKSPDYFEVKTRSKWIKANQPIYLSHEFMKWVSGYALRHFNKQVKWDNLNLRFWLEDL